MRILMSSGELSEPPVEIKDINVIVIKDESDNPIFFAEHMTNGSLYVIDVSDPKFEEVIKQRGLVKRLAVELTSV